MEIIKYKPRQSRAITRIKTTCKRCKVKLTQVGDRYFCPGCRLEWRTVLNNLSLSTTILSSKAETKLLKDFCNGKIKEDYKWEQVKH